MLLALLLFCGAPAIAIAQAPTQQVATASAAALVVNGDVPTPLSLSLDDLRHMPRKTVTAMNGHTHKQ